jgi:Fur family transcriptional regulator, ferric uptake regulator
MGRDVFATQLQICEIHVLCNSVAYNFVMDTEPTCQMTEAELLRHHNLRVTALRVDLLRILRSSSRALTHHDLESQLHVEADRVSVFRSLNTFEEAGLVHRVLDGRGTSCFAPCGTTCSPGHHHDPHPHFRCLSCGHVFCLGPIDMPKVRLPLGFKLKAGHLELEGTCKSCK